MVHPASKSQSHCGGGGEGDEGSGDEGGDGGDGDDDGDGLRTLILLSNTSLTLDYRPCL